MVRVDTVVFVVRVVVSLRLLLFLVYVTELLSAYIVMLLLSFLLMLMRRVLLLFL